MNYFQKNVRYLRKSAGMTQKDLSRKLGYETQATVSHWERGAAEPTMGMVQTLAYLFDVTVNDLLTVDLSNMSKASGVSLSESELELVGLYRQLNQEGQEKLLDYLSDLTATGKYKKHGEDLLVEENA